MESVTDRCPWCGSLISRAKFLEVESRIREEERKRLAAAEIALRKRLEEKFDQDLAVEVRRAAATAQAEAEKCVATVTTERDQIVQKLRELEAREADVLKQALEEASQKAKNEAVEQRAILQRHFDQELMKKGQEFNREREAYQKKLKEMERQVQRKTAGELGDRAEIDLFETLRESFPEDRIKRVQKGQPGADLLHEIVYKGDVCGRIIYDSKNRQAWQNGFVVKLREDQVTAKAEHAILSTVVFPSGKKELCGEGGVIVANPARVVAVVELLRSAMIRMHVLGLSHRARDMKTERLYQFITSQAYSQRTTEAENLVQAALGLDVEEQRQHQTTWKKRGLLVVRLKNVLREIDTEISTIVECPGTGAITAA